MDTYTINKNEIDNPDYTDGDTSYPAGTADRLVAALKSEFGDRLAIEVRSNTTGGHGYSGSDDDLRQEIKRFAEKFLQ